MRDLVAIIALGMALTGCATTRIEKVPSASELVGTYDMGDGEGICREVSLRPDGSMSGLACGGEHIGFPSREFSGTWSLSGATLIFSTSQPYIDTSEVFFYQGAPAFVELRNKHGSQVEPWAVFTKRVR